jgi:hypothetical protein
MVQLTIRCHPRVPISADELEEWLDGQVNGLRAKVPQGTVRLSRLTQGFPSADVDIGWLLELELPEEEPLLRRDRLDEALTDMRLLGLQPTLLAPLDSSYWSSARDDRVAALPSVGEANGCASDSGAANEFPRFARRDRPTGRSA